MKFTINQKITPFFLLTIFFFSAACHQGLMPGSGAATPTDAYKQLYIAVKAKKIEDIKAVMTKQSLALAETQAKRTNQTFEKVLENGFTGTTFSSVMPETRDERVKDNMGAVEVWNSKESKWEDLPFINENGWKLAVGDIMSNTFKSPGDGRAQIEAEAANKNNPLNIVQPNLNAANAPVPNKNLNNK